MYKFRSLLFCAFITVGALIFSCKKSQNTGSNATITQANNTPVNIQVYISSYPSLNNVGGYAYIANAGVKGILVYRTATEFKAYERSCTYDGTTQASAKVWVESGNMTLCKDSACGSEFNLYDGSKSSGPASFALKQYTATYDGTNVITIRN